MGFKDLKLNDGREIPAIGYGTGLIGYDEDAISQIQQGISLGFRHIDTAQAYGNETEAGDALIRSGIERKDVWITTKFSGVPGLSIRASIEESLKKLGVAYVDLYLIHNVNAIKGDIAGAWREFELLKKEGLAKSIGVSNFSVDNLKELFRTAEVKPAVNQILLHPYVYSKQKELIEFQNKHNIVTEAYSSLIPIRRQPGGPVDKPVAEIGKRLGLAPEQVLLAWVKAKGAVILTTSSKEQRLKGYLAVGDIDLSAADVEAIDAAGRRY